MAMAALAMTDGSGGCTAGCPTCSAAASAASAALSLLVGSLCGGAALFTSIHLPRIRWCSYLSRAAATAVAPSLPGRKQMKPNPRERLVTASIITTASDTTPKFSKYSRSSLADEFWGSPPTKSLFVPGTARFTSTCRPLTTWLSRRAAAARSASMNVTYPKPRERPSGHLKTTASETVPYFSKYSRRCCVVLLWERPPTKTFFGWHCSSRVALSAVCPLRLSEGLPPEVAL
mmetsp:Transcript_37891/g.98042  ORF Transcript_37891/g.98042 Transcript_37891/m.98042 type:complete len:232 (+) Transcript_37891:694-1389(+)